MSWYPPWSKNDVEVAAQRKRQETPEPKDQDEQPAVVEVEVRVVLGEPARRSMAGVWRHVIYEGSM